MSVNFGFKTTVLMLYGKFMVRYKNKCKAKLEESYGHLSSVE